jgi:hypothetical protein
MRTNGLVKAIAAAAAAGLLLSWSLNAPPAQAQQTASACKGLAEAACKAKTAECGWIVPKTGKQKPYCRSKPAKKK